MPVGVVRGWHRMAEVRFTRVAFKLTLRVSVHAFDPLSARWPRLERLAKILRLADYLPTLEFHDAHHVKRLPVIGEDEFADPKIAATQHASDGEALDFSRRHGAN